MDRARAVVLKHPAFDRPAIENETRRGRPAGAVSLALARRRQLDRRDEKRRVGPSVHGNAIEIRLYENGDIEWRFGGRFRESRRETAAALSKVLTAVLED